MLILKIPFIIQKKLNDKRIRIEMSVKIIRIFR